VRRYNRQELAREAVCNAGLGGESWPERFIGTGRRSMVVRVPDGDSAGTLPILMRSTPRVGAVTVGRNDICAALGWRVHHRSGRAIGQ
jgi:hypothetical protein